MFGKLFETAQRKRKRQDAGSSASETTATATTTPHSVEKRAPAISRDTKLERTAAVNVQANNTRKRQESSPQQVSDRKTRRRTNKKRRQPPTQEALDLSTKLKDLSRQKRLPQALALYWSQENVRDEHHACIVVDCCARCGAVQEAERVVAELQADSQNKNLNVETQTALIKAYAHAGRIHEAIQLFRKMALAKEQRPNLRTLNTLLRGCLWTAATVGSKNEKAGGVVTSEQAWKLYTKHVGATELDASAFEYSITLLCQALRTRDAQERIQDFQIFSGIRIKGKASVVGGDQASLETLGVAYMGLARAHVLRGEIDNMWQACQRSLCAVRASRAQQSEATESASQKRRNKKVTGGKRAWKELDNDDGSRRSTSNQTFRLHRLREVENEALALLKLRKEGFMENIDESVKLHLLCRLFYFCGGGTTDLSATKANCAHVSPSRCGDKSESLSLVPLWQSFGLGELVDKEMRGMALDTITRKDVFDHFDIPPLQPVCGNGRMNFKDIFQGNKLPIDIELGAGFGEWITRQAQENKDRNYVAVELRADRVAQIFARGILAAPHATQRTSLNNLCVVGSECGSFLRDRVPPLSISTIFVNHPEPPTQTYGDDRDDLQSIIRGGNEPAHMLNSATISAMASCLKTNGKIVVVTDNRWYARLLCATVVRGMRTSRKDNRLCSAQAHEFRETGLQCVETFGISSSTVKLFEGQPNEAIGHASYSPETGGASYFDRLWRSGAGNHAETKSRFIVVLWKTS